MPIEAALTAPSLRESLESAVATVVTEDAATIPAPAEQPAQTSEAAKATPAQAPAQETEAQKAERLRDEKGRFVEGKPEAKVEAKPAEAVKPKTPRPTSWKKEMEQHGETLAPEVQSYLNERERQYATGVSTYKTEADRAKGVMQAIAPFEPMLQQARIPVDVWVQNLGNAHRILTTGTPQERVGTIAQIIRNNGVDANALFQLLSGQQPQYQQPAPQQQQQPQPVDIQSEVQRQLLARDVDQMYTAFTKAVAEGKYPHYEAEGVKETMGGLLQSGLAEDYASAYEATLSLPKHRHLREAELQTQATQQPAAAPETKQAAAARARSQAVSVKSSTPSTMTQASGPKGLRDMLSENLDRTTSGRV